MSAKHIFKNSTQPIQQTDVNSTVTWLEQLTSLPLMDNMVGNTGVKSMSGDIDLAVDATQSTKKELVATLTKWAKSYRRDPTEWIHETETIVYLKTPIAGRDNTGVVRTDFMFFSDMIFGKFYFSPMPLTSKYRGSSRNILMNSAATAAGYTLHRADGLLTKNSIKHVTSDPTEIAKLILNKKATPEDLSSVESILSALQKDPLKDKKLANFREYANRKGIPFNESIADDLVQSTDSHFLARLRDRIINQGMSVIVETNKVF
jgi:hypothetical protein